MPTDMGTLTPEQMLQQQQILRQQKMAEMLMQQGMEQPKGQMISGHYVAPSFTQNLANLANMYVGQRAIEKGDQAQIDLAKAIREQKMGVLENINQALDAGDLKKARGIATANPEFAGQFAAPLIANAIPKTPDAVEKFKFAQTPEGGNFKGTLADFENQMTPYQKQSLALQAAGQNKPQIIETANGYVAVNPNNPNQATPVMFNGQQLIGNKGNLPEGANKQVLGATNLKDAIVNYKDTLKDFSTLDMANPDARAKMGNAYNNMMLQAKEAYNLGVLNGPDYKILQAVVKDPTKLGALLTSKEALQGQATDLSKQADKIIENVYKTHNRTVPANLLTPTPPAPSAKKGGIPAGITPAEWNAMSPADKKLFE
jgi:hypothetical protein